MQFIILLVKALMLIALWNIVYTGVLASFISEYHYPRILYFVTGIICGAVVFPIMSEQNSEGS